MSIESGAFSRRRAGFTLVELLVVIGIIAVLAAMIFPASQAIKKSSYRRKAKAEIESIATAIESYKAKYNHYPPDRPGNPLVHQLFYELLGTTNNTISYVTLDGRETLDIADISKVFPGLSGFINSTRPTGADDFSAGQRFLADLKPEQFGHATANGVRFAILTTSIVWPKDRTPLVDPSNPELNPIRYNSSSPTNNPKSYDLWVDIVVGGRTNRISNWSDQPEILP